MMCDEHLVGSGEVGYKIAAVEGTWCLTSKHSIGNDLAEFFLGDFDLHELVIMVWFLIKITMMWNSFEVVGLLLGPQKLDILIYDLDFDSDYNISLSNWILPCVSKILSNGFEPDYGYVSITTYW